MERETVKFLNNQLLVCWPESVPASPPDGASQKTSCDPRVVLFTGIPLDVDEEKLWMLLENTKRGLGAEVENIDFNEEAREAVVTFEDFNGQYNAVHILIRLKTRLICHYFLCNTV